MLIPREFIQRLREALLVSEVIGKRIPLKRHGREWQACCPFHQEKTPSFTINDAKGFYHCFGCGAHGDTLKFLMEYERLPYVEAIEALAREAGLSIPKPSAQEHKRESQRRNLEEVLEHAADWFSKQLHSSTGHQARDYLRQRGVAPEIQAYFRLGFAPDSRYALRDYLLAKGITTQQLVDAGLIIKPDNGQAYDRFRGRVIFPITDYQGNIIAFGGRLLAKDAKAAKYLNSPETQLFHKGQILYNWQSARAAMDDRHPLLVVEGYMDAIMLHHYGFPQAVAPLGTALTEEHLRKLWQACDAPILCLDGDAAGQRAMWRAAELALPLLQPGKSLRFCLLPAREDPDDFLRQHGAKAFQALLQNAQPLSRVIVEHVRKETGEDTPEQKAALEARLEQLAKRIAHSPLQQHFRSYFRQQLWPRKKAPRQAAQQVTRLATVDSRKLGMVQLERQLLRLILCQTVLLEQVVVEEELARLPLHHTESANIQRWLLENAAAFPECRWPETALALRDDNTVSLPACSTEQPLKAWQQVMENYTLVQMQNDLQALKQELLQEWSEARQQRIQELQRQIEALQSKRFSA